MAKWLNFWLFMLAAATHADERQPWWLEFGGGQGELEVVGHDRRELVARTLLDAGISAEVLDAGQPDDTDTRTLGVSYHINSFASIGVAYHDMGSTEGNFVAADAQGSGEMLSGSLDSKYQALSFALTGNWPLLSWFALQGKLGLHHWQHTFRVRSLQSTSGLMVDQTFDDSGTNILFGAGVGFTALPWLGFNIYWERFQGVEGEAGIDVKSLRAVIRIP